MQDIKNLAEAADELGKLTEKPWSQSEVLHYCSQKLIPLLAKVAILEEDIDAVRVQSKSAKWRNTIWQDAYGHWKAYVPIKPEAIWLLRQDGVARIKHPADGARAWPVREMLVNLEQVRVDTQTIHRIKSTFHQPIADPAQTATLALVSDSTPDPERRLSLLRSLGGTAKYSRSEWKFTGIKALVDSEKSDGRKRCDEKTIRADLKEAAQNERDAKRAGFADGLGQR